MVKNESSMDTAIETNSIIIDNLSSEIDYKIEIIENYIDSNLTNKEKINSIKNEIDKIKNYIK